MRPSEDLVVLQLGDVDIKQALLSTAASSMRQRYSRYQEKLHSCLTFTSAARAEQQHSLVGTLRIGDELWPRLTIPHHIVSLTCCICRKLASSASSAWHAPGLRRHREIGQCHPRIPGWSLAGDCRPAAC